MPVKRGRKPGATVAVLKAGDLPDRPPRPDDEIGLWCADTLLPVFESAGLRTLGDLVGHITASGKNWCRHIDKVGAGKAKMLESWLDANASTVDAIDRSGPRWGAPSPRLRNAPRQIVADVDALQLESGEARMVTKPAKAGSVSREGFAPIELMVVPHYLDGRTGQNRNSGPNLLNASNDYEAIWAWLNTYLAAGKLRTFDAYRREIERFYGWCLSEARVPFSGVTLVEAMRYQSFLTNIPAQYIGTARVTREDERWRPWRGQIDTRSQNYALGVVGQCYKNLWINGYLRGNPFASLKSSGGVVRTMDTTRSLSREDLDWVRAQMNALPWLDHDDKFKAAIARRTVLILHLLLKTGLRLEELATTTLTGLRRARVDGIEQQNEWLLQVQGKGKKLRDVVIPGDLLAMIQAHQEDAIELLQLAQRVSDERIEALRSRPPLICALMAPVGNGNREIDNEAVMANDNVALGRAGLYRTLKTFFRASAKKGLKEAKAALEKAEEELERADRQSAGSTSKRTAAWSGSARALVDQKRHEVEVWERRASMSTHWLRHTFAHEVLRNSRSDQGLKLAQQLLGHRSITTTAEYVKQDDSEKVLALRRVNPLGI